MKFSELTEKNKEKIAEIYSDKNISWDDKLDTIAKYISKGEDKIKGVRTVRNWVENGVAPDRVVLSKTDNKKIYRN